MKYVIVDLASRDEAWRSYYNTRFYGNKGPIERADRFDTKEAAVQFIRENLIAKVPYFRYSVVEVII
jgi:hypothetical protein